MRYALYSLLTGLAFMLACAVVLAGLGYLLLMSYAMFGPLGLVLAAVTAVAALALAGRLIQT